MSYEVFYALANLSFVLNWILGGILLAFFLRHRNFTMLKKTTPKPIDWNQSRQQKTKVW